MGPLDSKYLSPDLWPESGKSIVSVKVGSFSFAVGYDLVLELFGKAYFLNQLSQFPINQTPRFTWSEAICIRYAVQIVNGLCLWYFYCVLVGSLSSRIKPKSAPDSSEDSVKSKLCEKLSFRKLSKLSETLSMTNEMNSADTGSFFFLCSEMCPSVCAAVSACRMIRQISCTGESNLSFLTGRHFVFFCAALTCPAALWTDASFGLIRK